MSHTCLCLPSRSWYSFTDPQSTNIVVASVDMGRNLPPATFKSRIFTLSLSTYYTHPRSLSSKRVKQLLFSLYANSVLTACAIAMHRSSVSTASRQHLHSYQAAQRPDILQNLVISQIL